MQDRNMITTAQISLNNSQIPVRHLVRS